MSGEKRADVRLTAEAQREFDAEVDRARRAGDVLARLANLAGRVDVLVKEVIIFKTTGETSEAFRSILEAFVSDVERFRACRARLQTALAQHALMSAGAATQSGVEQLRRQRAAIDPPVRELEALEADLLQRLTAIEDGLSAEERRAEYREALRVADVRGQLEGLRGEIASRMHPGAFGSLQELQVRADALLERIDALASGSAPGASDVATCRATLDAMVSEATAVQRANFERFDMMTRIDAGCQGAGLERVTELRMAPLEEPLSSTYLLEEGQQKASMEFRIYRGRRFEVRTFSSMGETGTDSGATPFCMTELPSLIENLRRLGLDLRNFIRVDPDDPDRWDAIDLSVASEDPVIRRRKTAEKALEAGPT